MFDNKQRIKKRNEMIRLASGLRGIELQIKESENKIKIFEQCTNSEYLFSSFCVQVSSSLILRGKGVWNVYLFKDGSLLLEYNFNWKEKEQPQYWDNEMRHLNICLSSTKQEIHFNAISFEPFGVERCHTLVYDSNQMNLKDFIEDCLSYTQNIKKIVFDINELENYEETCYIELGGTYDI